MSEHEENDFNTESMGEGGLRKGKAAKIEQLGSFKIEKELSAGGGGTVYLAFDESMKRRVALKVLHPSLEITLSAQTRFAREAWIAGQLEHPNIIKVYSRGEENQLNYIALEYAESGSLSDYIKQLRADAQKSKDFTTTSNKEHIRSIVSKFVELANALEYIHSKGFIHRDIKPHNILLAGETKQFKLSDFGIAHAQDMTRMTRKGDFIGTVHYMSPEQITAHRTTVDNRTDIYSLGVTIYEALTLSLPFEADSDEKLIGEIISGHYIPARKRIRSISKDLETILAKATHHDATRRYQTAKELADDLQRFLDDKPIVARPDSVFYKAGKALSLKKRVNQVALIIILLVFAAGAIFTKIQQDKYDKEKILTTLKRAVETKTSPFEFEPDWPRLQHKLYEHVKKGKLDSTMIWFLRTFHMTKSYTKKFSVLNDAYVQITVSGIQIFDSTLSTKYTTLPLNHNVRTNVDSIFGSVPYSSSTLLSKDGNGIHFYRKPFTFAFFLKDELRVNQSGRLSIPIKVTNKHYFNTIDSSDISYPVFVETQTEWVETYVFDQWPTNFPQGVNDLAYKEKIAKNTEIYDFQLTKISETIARWIKVKWTLTCKIIDNPDRIPIAGQFEILRKESGDRILSGNFTSDSKDGGVYISFNELGISGEVRKLRSEINSYKLSFKDSVVSKITSIYGWRFHLNDSRLQELEELGKIDVTMIVYPSIEVAREIADVSRFWGDTVSFDFTFQAFDSSDSN